MWNIPDAWLMKGVFLGLLSLAMVLSSGSEAGAEAKPVRVKLTTGMGDIVLELYPDKAPATVANFLQYVKEGHYNGTVFHRVINGFMIQGGGLDAEMREKPTRAPIQNEADNGLKNEPYTIAMARTGAPHSATSQFFINVADNKSLNHRDKTPAGWGYTCLAGWWRAKTWWIKSRPRPPPTRACIKTCPNPRCPSSRP
jgi:peptidyl-prolyl cis-trans isomerase B (cyclophilin B)